MTGRAPAAIEIEDLHVRRGDRDVLRGLSLGIAAGRVIGLLGPSGSGKTTLGIALRDDPIERLEPDRDAARIVFAHEASLDRRTIFLPADSAAQAAQLGCAALEDRLIEVNDFGQTNVPGLFAAGDMARRTSQPQPAAQVIHAASRGGIAAAVADRELLVGRRPIAARRPIGVACLTRLTALRGCAMSPHRRSSA